MEKILILAFFALLCLTVGNCRLKCRDCFLAKNDKCISKERECKAHSNDGVCITIFNKARNVVVSYGCDSQKKCNISGTPWNARTECCYTDLCNGPPLPENSTSFLETP